jgi:hypothetical protein
MMSRSMFYFMKRVKFNEAKAVELCYQLKTYILFSQCNIVLMQYIMILYII